MERTGGGERGDKLGLVHDLLSRSDSPLISKVTVANDLRSGTERGLRTRARHAHEPALPPPLGPGSLPSTALGRRGVEPLARARVLPGPALPRYPGPLSGVVSRCPASPRSSRSSRVSVELCIHPSRWGCLCYSVGVGAGFTWAILKGFGPGLYPT